MGFLAAVFSRNGGAAVLLSFLLGACTVVVDEGPGPRPGHGPRPDQQYCTREYEPVCARRGDDRQTFSNPCLARQAGYRIVSGGTCRSGGNSGGGGNGGGNWGGGNGGGNWGGGGQQACTRDYRPVCARRGGALRTFPNACVADSAGYRVVDNGPC